MKLFRLEDMKGGWFVGDFEPTCLRTPAFEAACKHYKAGDSESRHVHKIAPEITLIAYGSVEMNGRKYLAGDIIFIEPGESTNFHANEDTITVVVKVPSVAGDKYPA